MLITLKSFHGIVENNEINTLSAELALMLESTQVHEGVIGLQAYPKAKVWQ
jgi:hypothetical protein